VVPHIARRAAWLLVLSLGIVAIVLTAATCRRRAPVPDVAGLPETVDFNFHVKPILSDRCFACHGPDERVRKASLRLDRKEIAFGRLPSGRTAIVAGDIGRSALVARITSADPKVMMPPPDSHLSLNDYERAVLIRWIDQGAQWKPHWSFIPPRPPAIPAVTNTSWAKNEIDRFVLHALEGRGREPSKEASRETLIRRVTFDLTGLPPTVEEIDAFVQDQQPGAYERVVDRLLASPAYGERMANEWMDIARYADSHGYQDDGMRQMWPWRDWVISAFNRNLPYDKFITWQLAGDLLPNATQEQRLATGFNRNHMQSQEGGIVPEEYRTEYVVDRVNTFGRAFLGLSVECARCHDHKYDPIEQKEFYRLFSFFNNVNESGQIPYSGVPSPTVILTDADTDARLATLREHMEPLMAATRMDAAEYDAPFEAWLARGASAAHPAADEGLIAWLPLDAGHPATELQKGDPKKHERSKQIPIVRFDNAANPREYAKLGGDKDRAPVTVGGRIGGAQQLRGDSQIQFKPEFAFFERNEPFSLGIWLRIDKAGTAGPLITRSGGIFNGNRGYEIILRKDGTFTAALHHVFPDNSIEIETTRPIAPSEWHHLALTYDGSSRAAGLRLFVDGAVADSHVRVDHLRRSILYSGDEKNKSWGDMPPLRIGRRHDETLQDVSVDELRVYDRQLAAVELASLARQSDALAAALAKPADGRSSELRSALREYFVLRVDKTAASKREALAALRGKENEILTSRTEVMAMRDLPQPRPTFILARGAYDAPTDRVTPGTPHAVGDFPKTLPPNRLGLAEWLVDPRHPLTSRVVVNRYWALFFGRGIVATPGDFGNQGRLPTHPELLDWLATTFVESGWNVKALHKRIVMSATYQQSSHASPDLLEQDPANELLARGPSYRLAAEQIRDAALAASGLLAREIGGPSVYPYQPAGLWEALATRNATSYPQGHGDDLYRRSLYTIWKRSTPPPSALSFDASERLFCTISRQRTNTPLQSLVLLNDPQYVEAARVLAERMIKEGGPGLRERIVLAFRALTGRHPDDKELGLLTALYDTEHARFARNRSAALQLLRAGEHPRDARLDAADVAAATMVATTIMNFDEFVMKR
jgi:hypothetical protein